MDESMDRVLAYRNFLAAEDHLDELLSQASSSDERAILNGIKWNIIYLRDDVMPKEVNKDYHCVVKHVATAYEACREVAKATHDELDINRARATRDLLIGLLERLWGRRIITCERCKDAARRVQAESAGDSTETTDDGLARDSIQRVGDDRVISIFGSEAVHDFRGETDGTEPEIAGRETEAPF
jgi:hypothetical protein